MFDATILTGDALTLLKTLPACSVQCVVTSPPYFGLRSYGTDYKIWGGNEECRHNWKKNIQAAKGGRNLPDNMPNVGGNKTQQGMDNPRFGVETEFCSVCGAWRGELGLEPSPELFVEHLTAVFREVWRVLKDDGTLWLNLGDSYWGGKGQSSQAWSTEHQDRNTLQKAQHQITGKGETRPTDGKHPVIKAKDLIGIPWMVAFALRADGWYLRSEIIWAKPNPMPESVKDRPTKSHEQIFLFSKSPDYFYDYEAILEIATGYDGRKDTMMKGSKKYKDGEYLANGNANSLSVKGRERWTNTMPKNLQADGQQPNTMHKNRAKGLGEPQGYGLLGKGFKGHSRNLDAEGNPLGHDIDGVPARNKRDVWFVSTKPYKEAHFATFPTELIEPCILAGSKEGDTVLDPFMGSGTTLSVAKKHARKGIGIELNPNYIKLAEKRINDTQPTLFSCDNIDTDQSNSQPDLLPRQTEIPGMV